MVGSATALHSTVAVAGAAAVVGVVFAWTLTPRSAFVWWLTSLGVALPIGDHLGFTWQYVFGGIVLVRVFLTTSRPRGRVNPTLVASVGLFAAMAIAAVRSPYPSQLGFGIAFFFVTATAFACAHFEWRPGEGLAILARASACSGGIALLGMTRLPLVSALVPAQTVVFGTLDNRYRLLGPLYDYELLGELMALGLVAWVALRLSPSPAKRLPVWHVVIMAAALALTGTRSAIVIAAVGPAVLLLGRRRAQHLTAAVVGLIATAAVSSGSVRAAVTTGGLGRFGLHAAGTGISNEINRAATWQLVTSELNFRPFALIGNGPRFPWEVTQIYPHDLGLTLVFLGGGPAVVMVAVMILHALSSSWRRFRQAGDELAWAAVCIIALFVLDEVKIEATRVPSYLVLVTCLLGMFARTVPDVRHVSGSGIDAG